MNGRRPWLVGLCLLLLLIGALMYGMRAQVRQQDPARNNPDKSIVLLTTSWCPYCRIMRESLQQSGVPFRELDVETSEEGRRAFRASGASGIPVTLIGQRYISGGVGKQLQAIQEAGYPIALAIPDATRRQIQSRQQ